MNKSPLEEIRLKYNPKLPEIFKNLKNIEIVLTNISYQLKDKEKLKKYFKNTFAHPNIEFITSKEEKNFKPLRVACVFSGGQAPGGHNVISGLYDALKKLNSKSRLFGYLNGPDGIIKNDITELKKDKIDNFRNLGGFEMIGSGRGKIETEEQLKQSLSSVNANSLDGLVIIGGDDSNTNAAILAEYFKSNNSSTKVIGVPKTIDGDLKNENIEISFGFDTATKVYSELIGNIAKDAISAKKYYHFIKVMGRSASHIALECALKTRPNIVLIGEEVLQKKKSLSTIIKKISDIIEKRIKNGKNYGIILIPEGLFEFIFDFKILIKEINAILAKNSSNEKEFNNLKSKEKISFILKKLSESSNVCFSNLDETFQKELILDRDPHGNVKLSQIETEKLILDLVKKELLSRKIINFNGITHFFGYEGRACIPSNFDADLCYSLGFVAAILVNASLTGYISSIGNLKESSEKWLPKGVPIVSMMNIEERHGKEKPVIKKALVDLSSKSFLYLQNNRENLAINY